jgi:hypothetical protein
LAALPAGIGFGAIYAGAGGPTALLVSAGALGLGVLLWLGLAKPPSTSD